MNAPVVVRREHDNIGALKRRLDDASAPGGRKLNIAGEQRIALRVAPPPMKTASASMPCFLKRPRSSATQIALLVGLNAPMPIPILSRPQTVAASILQSVTIRKPQRIVCRIVFTGRFPFLRLMDLLNRRLAVLSKEVLQVEHFVRFLAPD